MDLLVSDAPAMRAARERRDFAKVYAAAQQDVLDARHRGHVARHLINAHLTAGQGLAGREDGAGPRARAERASQQARLERLRADLDSLDRREAGAA